MISWSAWNRRNKWFWEKINGSERSSRHCNGQKDEWRPGDRIRKNPEEWWLEINMDAAIFCHRSIGVVTVIQDSHRGFTGAGCCKVDRALSPREAEAISTKEILSWVIKRNYKQCVFETDSKCLVTVCNGSLDKASFETC